MKGVYIVSITATVLLIFIFQWKKLKNAEMKEKAAVASIMVIGWAAAVLYVIFPKMSSPAKMLDFILVQLRNMILGI